MGSISSWLREGEKHLREVGVESARLDCLLLLEDELGKPREWILAHSEQELSLHEQANLDKKVARRIKREPLAYILGSKEFYGRNFYVNEHVLIPRPESEAIIELLRSLPTIHYELPTIFDVGTGSGCLAITAKLLFPTTHVTALDISTDALKVARKNARTHGVQIQFRQLDIFKELPKMPKTRPYAMLVNLPYVPDNLITSDEITKEPTQAIFSGKDGMNHYREFWEQIAQLKNKPVYIITESLATQHQQMSQLAAAHYRATKVKDLVQLFTRIEKTPSQR